MQARDGFPARANVISLCTNKSENGIPIIPDCITENTFYTSLKGLFLRISMIVRGDRGDEGNKGKQEKRKEKGEGEGEVIFLYIMCKAFREKFAGAT